MCVELEKTNIDDETVRRIQNSPRITVTQDDGMSMVGKNMSIESWERFISSFLTIFQSAHVKFSGIASITPNKHVHTHHFAKEREIAKEREELCSSSRIDGANGNYHVFLWLRKGWNKGRISWVFRGKHTTGEELANAFVNNLTSMGVKLSICVDRGTMVPQICLNTERGTWSPCPCQPHQLNACSVSCVEYPNHSPVCVCWIRDNKHRLCDSEEGADLFGHGENTDNRCNIVDPDVTRHSLLYIHIHIHMYFYSIELLNETGTVNYNSFIKCFIKYYIYLLHWTQTKDNNYCKG